MHYQSTRGAELGSFSAILLQGLAPDGGLAMPCEIKRFDLNELKSWRGLPYHEVAFKVMQPYISDIPTADLSALLQQVYTAERFATPEITPLKKVNKRLSLLQLSNGPSLAFKDVALQCLGALFEYVLRKNNKKINILGATSGDTGSAAEYAVMDKANINIVMLSPHGRMSPFQQAQMYSLQAPNVHNIAIEGVFDDCQDLVKALNEDADFKEQYCLSAVNSINWARILAQSVYYVYAYLQQDASEINVCVPSGNFGNVFAGLLAQRMGVPIKRFLVATNENDVLAEFFATGVYRPRGNHDVAATSSPSMDIGKASNFERYLYLLSGGDAALIRQLWQQLREQGAFDLKGSALWAAVQASGFSAYRSTHQQRIEIIQKIYREDGVMLDPHTADGVVAWLQRYPDEDFVVLETALPAKFAATIEEALQLTPPRPARFEGIEQRPQRVQVLANDAQALRAWIERHLS